MLKFRSRLTIFGWLAILIIKGIVTMNTGKRRYRELSPETKMKISQSLKGRLKTPSHIEAISKGLRDYWQTIPHKPDENDMGDVF